MVFIKQINVSVERFHSVLNRINIFWRKSIVLFIYYKMNGRIHSIRINEWVHHHDRSFQIDEFLLSNFTCHSVGFISHFNSTSGLIAIHAIHSGTYVLFYFASPLLWTFAVFRLNTRQFFFRSFMSDIFHFALFLYINRLWCNRVLSFFFSLSRARVFLLRSFTPKQLTQQVSVPFFFLSMRNSLFGVTVSVRNISLFFLCVLIRCIAESERN